MKVPYDTEVQRWTLRGWQLQMARNWDWFWGSTFSKPVGWSDAQQAQFMWVRMTAERTGRHICATWAIEPKGGSHHIHALIEVIGEPLTTTELRKSWANSSYFPGHMILHRFDVNRRGGEYVAKLGSVDIEIGCPRDRVCRRRRCVVRARIRREWAALRGNHRATLYMDEQRPGRT